MTPFAQSFTGFVSALTVIGDIFAAALLVFYLARKEGWARSTIAFVHRWALWLGFLFATAATAGSLFYSNVIGFPPCELCWIQRIFMYPQMVILAIALRKRDREALDYSFWLSLIGGVVAIYNIYLQSGGTSLLPCSATGPSCAQIFFLEFGYVTIPVMSLTVFAILALIARIDRLRHE